jgi:hypothetical protein
MRGERSREGRLSVIQIQLQPEIESHLATEAQARRANSRLTGTLPIVSPKKRGAFCR